MRSARRPPPCSPRPMHRRAKADRPTRRAWRGQVDSWRRTGPQARDAVRRARSGDRNGGRPSARRCLHAPRRGVLPPRRREVLTRLLADPRRWCSRPVARSSTTRRTSRCWSAPTRLAARETRRPLEPRRRARRSATDGGEPARVRRAARPARGSSKLYARADQTSTRASARSSRSSPTSTRSRMREHDAGIADDS